MWGSPLTQLSRFTRWLATNVCSLTVWVTQAVFCHLTLSVILNRVVVAAVIGAFGREIYVRIGPSAFNALRRFFLGPDPEYEPATDDSGGFYLRGSSYFFPKTQ